MTVTYKFCNQPQELKDDTPLYRILPLERFLQFLTERKNTLVSPFEWEDPFEILFDSKFIDYIKKKYLIVGKAPILKLNYQNWFAQCWSKVKESDAMWRVFTKNTTQRCVKIETLYKNLNEITKYIGNDVRYYLKAVKYGNIDDHSFLKKIDEWEDVFPVSDDDTDEDRRNFEARTLLTKRSAFMCEEEVRLLAYVTNPKKGNKIFDYDIDPLDLITGVQLDPWTPKETYKAIEIAINACLMKGRDRIKVKPSVLYDSKTSKRILLDQIYSN